MNSLLMALLWSWADYKSTCFLFSFRIQGGSYPHSSWEKRYGATMKILQRGVWEWVYSDSDEPSMYISCQEASWLYEANDIYFSSNYSRIYHSLYIVLRLKLFPIFFRSFERVTFIVLSDTSLSWFHHHTALMSSSRLTSRQNLVKKSSSIIDSLWGR
jgi:hypothetical protein